MSRQQSPISSEQSAIKNAKLKGDNIRKVRLDSDDESRRDSSLVAADEIRG